MIEQAPWDDVFEGLDPKQFNALLVAGFAQNRAKERLAEDNYESSAERHRDMLLVGLPKLLTDVGTALDQMLTQRAEDLTTIEEGPDDVGRRHPELTTIPADAFWSKGDAVGVNTPEVPT